MSVLILSCNCFERFTSAFVFVTFVQQSNSKGSVITGTKVSLIFSCLLVFQMRVRNIQFLNDILVRTILLFNMETCAIILVRVKE